MNEGSITLDAANRCVFDGELRLSA
jgi:hypothetical protein